MEIKLAKITDLHLLSPTLLELRPHLSLSDLQRMLPILFQEGYQIAYIGDEKLAYSIAGFRTVHFLYSGKTLYIDDLVTHPAHLQKGYAGALLNWLKQFAKENKYEHFALDSGFQRKDAHRLYLNAGLELESFHFAKKVVSL